MPPEPADDFIELNASLPNYRMCWQIKDCDEDEPNCRDPVSEGSRLTTYYTQCQTTIEVSAQLLPSIL